jgi:hypothetical protein
VDPDEAHRLLLSPRSSSQVTRQCGHGQDADVGAAACQRPVPSCRAVRGWRLFSTPSRAAQRWPGLPARRPPVAARPAHRGIDPSSMVDMLAAKRASFRYAGTPNDSKRTRETKKAGALPCGNAHGFIQIRWSGRRALGIGSSGDPGRAALAIWPASDPGIMRPRCRPTSRTRVAGYGPPEQILKTGVGTSRQSPPRGMLAAQTPSSRRLKRAPYRSGTTSPLPAASLGSVAPRCRRGPLRPSASGWWPLASTLLVHTQLRQQARVW